MIDINGKITFNCQHGPEECYGNALHACAIDILKKPADYVNFNACLMKDSSTDDAADEVIIRVLKFIFTKHIQKVPPQNKFIVINISNPFHFKTFCNSKSANNEQSARNKATAIVHTL